MKLRNILISLILILLITFVLFFFIEGVCSVWSVLSSPKDIPRERKHTQYDPEIGWVNIPNIFVKDIYGKGTYLKTNSQGFRNEKDFSIKVPKDKLRIICSGDSFTLGYGVSNDQAWCQYMTSLDHNLETVNMGQGGYGVDQAYLLYMREGTKLDHQIQLFAFIKEDIIARSKDNFFGFGKPYFKLNDNKLVLCNVPVPKRPYYWPWLTSHISDLKKLKSVSVFSGLYVKSFLRNEKKEDIQYDQGVILKIIDELDKSNKAQNSVLVTVLLPKSNDFEKNKEIDASNQKLRSFLHKELKQRKVIFLDLFDDFQGLSKYELKQMFKDHYSPKGNRYVAELIYQKLRQLNLLKIEDNPV